MSELFAMKRMRLVALFIVGSSLPEDCAGRLTGDVDWASWETKIRSKREAFLRASDAELSILWEAHAATTAMAPNALAKFDEQLHKGLALAPPKNVRYLRAIGAARKELRAERERTRSDLDTALQNCEFHCRELHGAAAEVVRGFRAETNLRVYEAGTLQALCDSVLDRVDEFWNTINTIAQGGNLRFPLRAADGAREVWESREAFVGASDAELNLLRDAQATIMGMLREILNEFKEHAQGGQGESVPSMQRKCFRAREAFEKVTQRTQELRTTRDRAREGVDRVLQPYANATDSDVAEIVRVLNAEMRLRENEVGNLEYGCRSAIDALMKFSDKRIV